MTYPQMHDLESEKDQEFTDNVNKIYSESLKPANMEPLILVRAFAWGLASGHSAMQEISGNIWNDDAYNGALLGGLVRDYLFHCAELEAENK